MPYTADTICGMVEEVWTESCYIVYLVYMLLFGICIVCICIYLVYILTPLTSLYIHCMVHSMYSMQCYATCHTYMYIYDC